MTTFEPDIFRVSRPWSDYDLDVFVGGEWVASAKNNHHADEAALESWRRTTSSQLVIADVPAGNTDRDGSELSSFQTLLRASVMTGHQEPNACATCDGEGRIPADGSGDQAGGWAETCPDCEGKGMRVSPPIDPLPDDFPGTDDENGTPQPRAYTLQSIAIEARIKRCVNCDGAHFTWQCPEIHAALAASAPFAELRAA